MVSPVAASLMTEPGAPQWAVRLAIRINDLFKPRNPTAPERVYTCASADAPLVSVQNGAVAFFSDIPTLAFFDAPNGVWLRADGNPI